MSSGKGKTTVEFWSARAAAASADSAAATTHFGSVVEAATIQVLDDIWSPWCAPCRKVSPALEQLAGEFAGRLKLVKVNADESPELRQRFEVLATPNPVADSAWRVHR
ncbi:MAG TPA: thioredoxin family protein [Propionibacteriaceae bacterium]|nr:thioredoxin family protein [Propionibacteriaceae bacterium]